MTQEKEKWMNQTANILKHLREENMYTEEFAKIGTEHEFFNDACNYVHLIHEIQELEYTLKNIIKYSKMSE